MSLIKRFIFSHEVIYKIAMKMKNNKKCRGGVKVENKGYACINKDIVGHNNHIYIGENTTIHKSSIYIRGNNNKLVIEGDCHIGQDCSFWIEGNDILIYIKTGTTITYGVHLCAQEDNTKIVIGSDCMLSNTIVIRTSDSHPIYDVKTNVRLNKASNVIIGNHVWIAPNVKIMKGVMIGDNSIIGTDTIVTKQIPGNVLAVGHPAKVVKTEIKWTRERLF